MRTILSSIIALSLLSSISAATFTSTAFVTAMPASIEVKGTYTLGQNASVISLTVDVGSYNSQTGLFTVNATFP